MDPEIEVILRSVAEGQARTEKLVHGLVTSTGARLNCEDVTSPQVRLEETVAHLSQTVDEFIKSGDVAGRRLEESLDGLIRALARKHSSGESSG